MKPFWGREGGTSPHVGKGQVSPSRHPGQTPAGGGPRGLRGLDGQSQVCTGPWQQTETGGGAETTKVPLGFTHTLRQGPRATRVHTAHTCTHTRSYTQKNQGWGSPLWPGLLLLGKQLTRTPCLWPARNPAAQPGSHLAEGRKWETRRALLPAHAAPRRWAVSVGHRETEARRPLPRTQHPAVVGQRRASVTARETVPAHRTMPRWVEMS